MKQIVLCVIIAIMTSGCARRAVVASSSTPAPPGGAPPPAAEARFETGDASWYGDPYDGRQAASGETFDKNEMTAAHRTLPFNTWVRVENQLNRKWVDVRINDRGPFVRGRIIDLSEGAARKIDMLRAGVVPVRLTVIREPEPTAVSSTPVPDTFYVVQLGAFASSDRARLLARRFEGRYTDVYVEAPSEESSLYRVRIGRALLSQARYVQDRLRREDEIDAVVIQVQ